MFYWLSREDPGEQPTLILFAFPLKMGVPGRGCALECKCFTGSPRRTLGSSPRSLATKYSFVLAEDPVDTVRRLLMQLSARREPAVRGCMDPLL